MTSNRYKRLEAAARAAADAFAPAERLVSDITWARHMIEELERGEPRHLKLEAQSERGQTVQVYRAGPISERNRDVYLGPFILPALKNYLAAMIAEYEARFGDK